MPVLYHYLDHDLFSCVHNRVGSSKLLTYFQGCSFYLQLDNGPKMASFCLTWKIILLGSVMANFESFKSMKDTIRISSFLDWNQKIRVSTYLNFGIFTFWCKVFLHVAITEFLEHWIAKKVVVAFDNVFHVYLMRGLQKYAKKLQGISR